MPRPAMAVSAAVLALSGSLGVTTAGAQAPNEPRAEPETERDLSGSEEVEPRTGSAGWDEGFFIRSADDSSVLKLVTLLQLRFAYAVHEGGPDETAFSIPRGRVGLRGNVFSQSLKYYFLAEFGRGEASLLYYYADYTVVPNYFAFRVGQQKRPFSRSFITPSEFTQLPVLPVAISVFGDTADIGVLIHNGAPTLEYSIGVFNGAGSRSALSGEVEVDPTTGRGRVTGGAFSNVPRRLHPAVVGRMAYNHGEVQPYSEGDLAGGPLRFSIGVAGSVDFDVDGDDRSFVRGTADALVKVGGLAAYAGFWVSSQQEGGAFTDRKHEATGYYVQGGWVLGRLEPVLRYGGFRRAEQPRAHQLGIGLNVYFRKHSLKWQNLVSANAGGVDPSLGDRVAETQFQLHF